MELNFYENLVQSEDKDKKELIKKMSKLLDDSLDSFIELRKRQKNEKINIIKVDSKINKNMVIRELFRINRTIVDENNNSSVNRAANRLARLERIRNMQEETENLERLIENDLEVIG